MTTEQLGESPYARKTALNKEVRDLINSLTPQPETRQLPDGYLGRTETQYIDGEAVIQHTASDSEAAEYLATLGIHHARYRQN